MLHVRAGQRHYKKRNYMLLSEAQQLAGTRLSASAKNLLTWDVSNCIYSRMELTATLTGPAAIRAKPWRKLLLDAVTMLHCESM